MRGWVYIISNEAIPDLIKIGFSMKDPNIRAKELSSSGVPFDYKVEYEILVHDPRELEQRAHRFLSAYRAGKEWFNCPISEAVDCLKRLADTEIILEQLTPETCNSFHTSSTTSKKKIKSKIGKLVQFKDIENGQNFINENGALCTKVNSDHYSTSGLNFEADQGLWVNLLNT